MLEKAAPFFYCLSEPFWKVTEWIERISRPIKKGTPLCSELACRVSLAVCCIFCAAPAIGLHAAGYFSSGLEISFRKRPYFKRGEGLEASEEKKLSLLTYNINFFGGGLPCWFGGVEPASRRVEKVAETIFKLKEVDIFCLQEGFNRHNTRNLLKALDKKGMVYEAYYGVGDHPIKFNSGLVVISRYKVSNVAFKAFKENKGKAINRGYFSGVVKGVKVIATHLDSSDAKLRKASFAAINKQAVSSAEPVVLLGDFNTDKSSRDCKEMFIDQGWVCTDLSQEPTCNEEVLKANRRQKTGVQKTEIVDYIAVNQRDNIKDFITERPFKLNEDPFMAESDHAPVKAVIAFA